MVDKTEKSLLSYRLQNATRVELDRVCSHLGIEAGTPSEDIEEAYIASADNSIFKNVRRWIPTEAPTYLKVLLLIYKNLRPYSEDIRDLWRRMRPSKQPGAPHRIEEMHEFELEELILELYSRKYKKIESKIEKDPTKWRRVASYIPGVGVAGTGAATTLIVQVGSRAPFAAAGAGAVTGPIGIALGVIAVGGQLAGPAFRKIIPATVEIMRIGVRIEHMPGE